MGQQRVQAAAEDGQQLREQARALQLRLRQRAMERIAQSLQERDWSQSRAAAYLGVTQPRISDLLRGKTERFTLDSLVAMLFALGCVVDLRVDGMSLSPHESKPTEEAVSAELVDFYTRLLQRRPDSAEALFQRAGAYRRLGLYEEALADYAQAQTLHDCSAEAGAAHVATLVEAERHADALQVARELLERHPEAEIHIDVGLAQQHLGDIPAAIASFGRVLERDPEHFAALHHRARLFESTGRYAEAFLDATRCGMRERDPVRQYELSQWALRLRGQAQAARHELKG